jgi:hypothetical protein
MRLLAILLLTIAALAFGQEGRGIGYPTVAAALEALKARSDVKVTVQNGWTIVEDRAGNAFWSFTPSGHPAHPAAVKRTIVSRDGGLAIDMTALCQAEKAACDRLIAEFKELNERMAQSMRKPLGAQSLPPSEIDVERRGDDSFRLVLKSFRSTTVDAGQEELLPRAREVCAGRSVAYGRYEFETHEQLSPPTSEKRQLVLRQDITCGVDPGPRPPTVSVANPDRNWRPTPAQVQLVERQTHAYFSAKDARRYQDAYALFSPTQRQTLPFERWSANAEAFNSKAGEVRNRSIKKITWYKDPPSGGPGVFAAVDFSSQFANVDVHCGYVAWQEQGDGSFLLVREEENFIDNATARNLKPGELERFRARFGTGC